MLADGRYCCRCFRNGCKCLLNNIQPLLQLLIGNAQWHKHTYHIIVYTRLNQHESTMMCCGKDLTCRM